MKIEARFRGKAPEGIEDIQKVRITHGLMVIEIEALGSGMLVRLDEPLGDSLVVHPRASNHLALFADRESDVSERFRKKNPT